MIRSIKCNKSSFKEVTFENGLNVILADRTKESTEKDSRNGLGKSTLIEIIHFCLGASISKGVLSSPKVAGWIFSMEFVLRGKIVTVSRDTASPSIVKIQADTTAWPIQPKSDLFGESTLSTDSWCLLLGQLIFGLPGIPEKTYNPSFRGLLSYFVRRGRDA
ncbi:MAG: DUF2326 domain-containing protein, partial [Proteobacteria bacterium]